MEQQRESSSDFSTIGHSLTSYRRFLENQPLEELEQQAQKAENGGRRWLAGLIRDVIAARQTQPDVSVS